MTSITYLDYNATAPPRAELRAYLNDIESMPYNPSSVHTLGRRAKKITDHARRQIAAALGAEANNVIFNSGATEGNNTVLKHFKDQKVIISAIEHPAVLEAINAPILTPVTTQGIIDLKALEENLIQHKPALVSCMLVNNETGIIQPIREIADLAQKYGAWLHCDAVQAIGRIPCNITQLGINFLTLSGHKIGAPQGIGALILGQCGETPTLLHGGGQEKKARAGTENVLGIAALGQAVELVTNEIEHYQKHVTPLRTHLESQLRARIPDIQIHGETQNRVPNTSFFSLPAIASQTVLMALDLEGICVSNGSACASGSVKESHVLKAMNCTKESASSAIRISIGHETKQHDIDAVINALSVIHQRACNSD